MRKIIKLETKEEINLEEHGILLLGTEEIDNNGYDHGIKIEVNHLEFATHLEKCKLCKEFYIDIGRTKLTKWCIEIDYIRYNIYLGLYIPNYYNIGFGSKISYYFYCKKMKINGENSNLDTLKLLLKRAEKNEEYEKCIEIKSILEKIA